MMFCGHPRFAVKENPVDAAEQMLLLTRSEWPSPGRELEWAETEALALNQPPLAPYMEIKATVARVQLVLDAAAPGHAVHNCCECRRFFVAHTSTVLKAVLILDTPPQPVCSKCTIVCVGCKQKHTPSMRHMHGICMEMTQNALCHFCLFFVPLDPPNNHLVFDRSGAPCVVCDTCHTRYAIYQQILQRLMHFG